MGPQERGPRGRCSRVRVSADEPSSYAGAEEAAVWHHHLALSVLVPAQIFTQRLLNARHCASQEGPKSLLSGHKCKPTASSREQPKHLCVHYTLSGTGNSHLKSFWGVFLRKEHTFWACLVAQWLRIRLQMQGIWVRALVREDPTCRGATKPVRRHC